jgi:hypothetical protein
VSSGWGIGARFEAGPGGGHEVGEATQFKAGNNVPAVLLTPGPDGSAALVATRNVWTDVEEGCKACARFKGEERPQGSNWASGPLVHSGGTTGPVGCCTRLCSPCYKAWSGDGKPPLWLGKSVKSINDEPGFQRAEVGVPGGVVSGAGVGEEKLSDEVEHRRKRKRESERLRKAKAKEGRADKGEGGGGEKA